MSVCHPSGLPGGAQRGAKSESETERERERERDHRQARRPLGVPMGLLHRSISLIDFNHLISPILALYVCVCHVKRTSYSVSKLAFPQPFTTSRGGMLQRRGFASNHGADAQHTIVPKGFSIRPHLVLGLGKLKRFSAFFGQQQELNCCPVVPRFLAVLWRGPLGANRKAVRGTDPDLHLASAYAGNGFKERARGSGERPRPPAADTTSSTSHANRPPPSPLRNHLINFSGCNEVPVSVELEQSSKCETFFGPRLPSRYIAVVGCLFSSAFLASHPLLPSLSLPGLSLSPYSPFLSLGRLCQRSPRNVQTERRGGSKNIFGVPCVRLHILNMHRWGKNQSPLTMNENQTGNSVYLTPAQGERRLE